MCTFMPSGVSRRGKAFSTISASVRSLAGMDPAVTLQLMSGMVTSFTRFALVRFRRLDSCRYGVTILKLPRDSITAKLLIFILTNASKTLKVKVWQHAYSSSKCDNTCTDQASETTRVQIEHVWQHVYRSSTCDNTCTDQVRVTTRVHYRSSMCDPENILSVKLKVTFCQWQPDCSFDKYFIYSDTKSDSRYFYIHPTVFALTWFYVSICLFFGLLTQLPSTLLKPRICKVCI